MYHTRRHGYRRQHHRRRRAAVHSSAAYDASFPLLNADIIGDMNQNGNFDFGDMAGFNVLFAGPAAASAQAIPEPTTRSLAVVLLMGIAIRQRRRG